MTTKQDSDINKDSLETSCRNQEDCIVEATVTYTIELGCRSDKSELLSQFIDMKIPNC